jgi:pimeloyl-ACP methyl ester carboxylesterase
VAFALTLLAATACAEPLPFGVGRIVVDLDGAPVEVHTYKPGHYHGAGLIVTLHGVARNAAGYRDYSVALGERLGMIVVAPLFDRERFPGWRYQMGGIVRERRAAGEQQVEPEARWFGRTLLALVAAVRSAEAAPQLPYSFIGHSGGAQALSRVAAFVPTEARRIVLANPGTYLWPARDLTFPFGFGGLPERLQNDAMLERYLAQPLVILLGTADVRQDADLNMSEAAMAQGPNRYERGRRAWRTAEALAKARGWKMNWILVEVPGVGHSGRRMLASEEAVQALTIR